MSKSAIKIAIIGSKTTKDYGLFDDLREEQDVSVFFSGQLVSQKKISSKILKGVRKIWLSQKVNRVIRIPGKNLWFEYQELLQIIDEYSAILIVDTALYDINEDILLSLKRKNPKLGMYLLVINTMNKDSAYFKTIKTRIFRFSWDKVFTFDEEDAQKYNWEYDSFHYYSMHDIERTPDSCDTVFIGALVGGRKGLILSLQKELIKQGIHSEFICRSWDNPDTWEKIPGLKYLSAPIPYKEALAITVKSNCIVEILQDDQTGPSLRYFEAVCYNKKLLTTNKHIMEYPFYNPKYMKVFLGVEDIDCGWIKETEDVDYHYNGEFSPKHLVDRIQGLQKRV